MNKNNKIKVTGPAFEVKSGQYNLKQLGVTQKKLREPQCIVLVNPSPNSDNGKNGELKCKVIGRCMKATQVTGIEVSPI
jgi:hypothetical protein